MAVLKMTAIVAAIKGKIAGTIFQGGISGQTARKYGGAHGAGNAVQSWWPNKNNPQNQQCRQANVQTSVTVCEAVDNPSILGYVFADGTRNANLVFPTQRSIISQLSTRWRNLDPAQSQSWTTGAVNFPFKNKFGESYTGSGYAVYQSINSGMLNSMQTPIDTCPIPSTVIAPTIVLDWSVDANAAIMLVNFPDGIPAGTVVDVYATPMRSAGRNSTLNLALIASFLPQDAFSVPLIYAYIAKFGAPQANGKLKTVFGGKGQIAMNTITIAQYDKVFTAASTAPLLSYSLFDRLKSVTDFQGTLVLGNLNALSEFNQKLFLYGTQLGDPWKLQTGGADAGAIAYEFNGVPDTAGVITGACDGYGNLPGFVLDLTISTGAIGAHTATLTLTCAAISFTKVCIITWTSV